MGGGGSGKAAARGTHEEALAVGVDDEHWTYPRLGGEVE